MQHLEKESAYIIYNYFLIESNGLEVDNISRRRSGDSEKTG